MRQRFDVFCIYIEQDVVSLEKIYVNMFAGITYKQSYRREFALLSGLLPNCFAGVAAGAAGMFYSKRMVSRAPSCPHGVSPLVKASANARLALLGRFDDEECSQHACVPFRACRLTKITLP